MSHHTILRPFYTLKISGVYNFGLKARFTPVENVPTHWDAIFMADRLSPRRAPTHDFYSKLPRDRLSWCVISNLSSKKVSQAVLRNRLKRRWASAFTEALKDHGYHHNGRKRSAPNNHTQYQVGLKGTLEILVFSERGIFCPHRELVGACHRLVKAVRDQAKNEAEAGSLRKSTEKDTKGVQPAGEVASSLWSLWRKML